MNEKKLLIGIVEPVGGHGGMDYYDYGLAMGLGANNVEVVFYTSNETKIREYPNVDTLFYFKEMWGRNFLIKVSKYLKGHYSAIKDMKIRGIKIIHLHFFTFRFIDLIILWYARINNLKLVVTIHDVTSFDKKANSFIERTCFNYINGVILHNQSSLNAFKEKFKVLIPSVIIPHGNYLPFIEDVSIIKGENTGKFTLLFFGQIKKVKGLDVLLEALSIVKKNSCQIELIIAGKAWKSDLNEYRELIKKLNLEDIVTTEFRYILDEEVASFYKQADLVVLPYREIYQSGVLLLTLSYGKPVLCSDLGAFKEIVIDNENGFLFDSGSPRHLAAKIEEIVLDRDNLQRVASKSSSMIRDRYDWIKIGDMTKAFYSEIVEN